MQELFWLLLPVAAASGWWAARRSVAQECRETDKMTSPAYFRGLNHLLNEEPDKAIDVFVQLVEVDSETVETHLALGSLFRRRGEVERAIRIHQNLIARPALSREHRALALLELGQDYMRAGLYDRAENLFIELKEMKLYVRKALENLRTIYQQEKEWKACLNVAKELEGLVPESLDLEEAHYYCELAEEARNRDEQDKAQQLLKKAVLANNECVRPIHMQAEMAIEQSKCKSAIKLLRQAAEKDPDYLPEVLPQIVECYRKLDQTDELKHYLTGLIKTSPYTGVALTMVELIRRTEGEHAASVFLGEQVAIHSSLQGVLKLIEINEELPDTQAAILLRKVKEHIQRLLAERPAYQCVKCGFVASTMHWQCPSCRSWSTIRRKPEIGEKIK
jgi:lipopolysaccharide biosynthesis regulator YciM